MSLRGTEQSAGCAAKDCVAENARNDNLCKDDLLCHSFRVRSP